MEKHINKRIENAQKYVNSTRPRLLPLRTAAEYLGLSVWAIRSCIWSGHIPVVQFTGGRKQYLDVHDLDKLIEQSKRIIK